MIRLPKFRYALLALFTLSVALQSPVDDGVITFGTVNKFDMTFVEIGDPGNVNDRTGDPGTAGSVAYAYQLGKYEVSRDMITKYNANYGTAKGLAIDMPSMSFLTGGARDAMPATGVSWNEAARFVNWLNTSRGYQAAYNFTTTGVNDNIALWSSAQAWQLGGENLFRHKDAHYWLPSMDEWYKAAYYDPVSGTYFDYPTSDGSLPTAVTGGTADKTAVYDQSFSQGPADITQAGGLSAYGIMGLGGNVWEWQETELDLLNDSVSSSRGVRGGGWDYGSGFLSSSGRGSVFPGGESIDIGFRVASLSSSANDVVPEPGSVLVWGLLGLAGFFVGRKRLRK